MGIENSLYRLTHTRQAIYSLPLMGIENWPGGLRDVLPERALITLHGDRKHVIQRDADLYFATHYPSWGSKTLCTRPIT